MARRAEKRLHHSWFFSERLTSRPEGMTRDAMDRLLDELAKGTALYKVKSASKLLQRTFSLDRKNMILHYDGTQKRFRSAKTDLRISQVREVREGEKDFSKKLNGLDKSLCFAVIVGANHKVIYLMAMRREMRDKWVRGLRYAIQMDKLAEQRNETDKYPFHTSFSR
ncbi:hypothetical protein SNE40_003289 [Patella caerulea]|uniref:PH domain-containing protein n=1 Tax=Patella caerulea TaxID=87958 RepID=A0AAN8Q0Q5_PATCE